MSSPNQGGWRAVSFSRNQEVIHIPNDAREERSYSREDHRRFGQEMILDARRMARIFSTTPDENITHDDLRNCVGIEILLSDDLRRHAINMKNAHADLILEQQHRGINEELRIVSERSSSWSRDRAQKMASSYMNLRDD